MKYQERTLKQYLVVTLKGMAMGAADVVPGVSGGTIAFITGIYTEFLHSLRQINPAALWVLKKDGLAAAWRHINGSFLLALFLGILISLKTFAQIITTALEHYPILVWSLFFGLISASILYFARQQKGWNWTHWLACLLGALFVYAISVATPAQLPATPLLMFVGGFIAICAMILPGVSGSFLLLLMGLYPAFLSAITNLDLVALASFGGGCICGLLLFSRFLSWLLEHFYTVTFAALIGFLIGSLNVTWPWKQTLETRIDRHGEVVPVVQENVLPFQYELLTGADAMTLGAGLFFLLGSSLVLITEYVSVKFTESHEHANA